MAANQQKERTIHIGESDRIFRAAINQASPHVRDMLWSRGQPVASFCQQVGREFNDRGEEREWQRTDRRIMCRRSSW